MAIKGKLGYDPRDGSKRMGQLHHEHQQFFDAQPTITRCGITGCRWSWEGPAAEGREMFAAHKRLQHRHDEATSEQEVLETSGDPELDELRDIFGHGTEVEIRLPAEPEPWRREWIESLGGRIVIDPTAPMPAALQNDRKDGSMSNGNGAQPEGWTRERCIQAIKDYAVRHGHVPQAKNFTPPWPSVDTVKRLCGSWADAVEAAGFERPRRGGKPQILTEPEPQAEPVAAPEPEPAPLPVPVEPSAPRPTADPEKVDAFELLDKIATEERIDYYEEVSEQALVKAQALRAIRDAVATVREIDAA